MSTTVANDRNIIFECIDGKDDHLKLELQDGQSVNLGCSSGEDVTAIKEMENVDGSIIVANHNGQLQLDASGCQLPVKVNGQPVTKTFIRPTDVVRIGNSIWKAISTTHSGDTLTPGKTSLTGQFGSIMGLEDLKDFKLKNIFSEVFKKHPIADMEDQLITGTIRNTPAITDIQTDWAKPWLFSRLLLVSFVVVLLLYITCQMFSRNPILVPSLMVVGAFTVPLATLIFYLEMNAPRNISVFAVMSTFFIAGVLSITISLLFFSWLPFLYKSLGASSAGIIEEAGKILLVALLFGRIVRYKWILNGLLLGAAIGAGFGAFESAGYAYSQRTFEGVVDVTMLRAVLAPFMHVVWTANAAGALWLVKGNKKFEWKMFGDMRFLRVMLSSMALHMTWNANFSILEFKFLWGIDVKNLILGVIAWVITFMLIQSGLKQLNEARHAEVQRLSSE